MTPCYGTGEREVDSSFASSSRHNLYPSNVLFLLSVSIDLFLFPLCHSQVTFAISIASTRIGNTN